MLKEPRELGQFYNSATICTILRLTWTSLHSCKAALWATVVTCCHWCSANRKTQGRSSVLSKTRLLSLHVQESIQELTGDILWIQFAFQFGDWSHEGLRYFGMDTAWSEPYHLLPAGAKRKVEEGFGFFCLSQFTETHPCPDTAAAACATKLPRILLKVQHFKHPILSTRGCLLPAQLYQSSLIFP